MKIRKKLPKPSRGSPPLYIVGYSSDPPALPYLQAWFDLQYGGPLRVSPQAPDKNRTGMDASEVVATHGPWSALVRVPHGETQGQEWQERLQWSHTFAAEVIPAPSSPAQICDQVLHAARLARGLTLLTEGTAYDLSTRSYLNPSDWQDRTLDRFDTRDHVIVAQGDEDRPARQWFHTLGLSKFGRDELESFQPVGLPGAPIEERLADIAAELIRVGGQLKNGQMIELKELGLVISVLGHRTAQAGGLNISLREIGWEEQKP